MRTSSLVLGGLVLAGLSAAAQADIGVYSVDAEAQSYWSNTDNPEILPYFGANDPKTYSAAGGVGYLSGTQSFVDTSTISAPEGAPAEYVLGEGSATGSATVNGTWSTATLHLTAQTSGSATYGGSPLSAGGAVKFHSAAHSLTEDSLLHINGTANVAAGALFHLRISEQPSLNATGPITDIFHYALDGSNVTDFQKIFNDDQKVLKAGHTYILDFYLDSGLAYVSSDFYEPSSSSSNADLFLTVTPIPEPAMGLTMLGVGVLALRRRRA